MLTIISRQKKRDSFDVADALCKALGWYFPLLSKLRVSSVEDLVFRKFPDVCPYCRRSPHDEVECKQVKGTEKTVNHAAVKEFYISNYTIRPTDLNSWPRMFDRIYPRRMNEGSRSIVGLMEELGELAEAVRVFDSHPHYFLGEAADTFSYLMGIANEHALSEALEGRKFDFQREFLSRYPGLCPQCGSRVCVCPAIPTATIGRMAKELQIAADEHPFDADLRTFAKEGLAAATRALESVGGYAGLVSELPFDRGDAKQALVHLCLRVADAVEESDSELATVLRGEAVKLGETSRIAGTIRIIGPEEGERVFEKLRRVWRDIDANRQDIVRAADGIAGELVDIIEAVRVLFIYSNPITPSGGLDLQSERRSVKEALRRGKFSSKFQLRDLPAATRDDLRRELLENEFDVVQFSGHSNKDELIFVDAANNPVTVPITAFGELVKTHPTIKCVVLTSCESGMALNKSLSDYTIVMDRVVTDDIAIAYSTGFYDALAAGRPYDLAHEQGLRAVTLAGLDASFIRLMKA